MSEDLQSADVMPHRGALILTLGILSLVMCQPLGIAAWLMGSQDLKEIKAGRMDREGEGLTQAGQIMGMISSFLMLMGLLLMCVWIAVVASAVGAGVAIQPN